MGIPAESPPQDGWKHPGFMHWKLLMLIPVAVVTLVSPPAYSSLGEAETFKDGLVQTEGNNPELLEIVGETEEGNSNTHLAVLRRELKTVCSCESGNGAYGEPQQFHEDGSVVRGIINPLDIGQCQINLKYWGEEAEELGYDIFTSQGNIKMANYIYDNSGLQPWSASKQCWISTL